MKRIFTKKFLALSAADQAAAVGAALQDIADGQHWVSVQDRQRAKRIRQRIIKKAIEYGILMEGNSDEDE